jgi:N-acetylmuramoyl-L-alanine amidase
MIAFAYYLLKVIICSGVLFLYYHIALRNKLFHQWNRFYLLVAIVISLVAPVIQISILNYNSQATNKAIQILQVFQSADGYLEEVTIRGRQGISVEQWFMMVYLIMSALLLVNLILSLQKIFSIIKSHTIQWVERIKFINTRASNTPFSFFNFIFWNEEISLHTETGQQIFRHELVHVKEKHTLDKLFVQLLLIIFWCNPFFWLIRRELRLIHEFIADKKAVGEQGTAALAAMILSASYPNRFNSITNQFFQTSIKRRLAMLTKNENPRISYLGRIVALPLLIITVLAFTLRTKNIVVPTTTFENQITVVIDAGHGTSNGKPGGVAVGDINEDAIVLAISKKIKELNKNDKLKIILTRTSNEGIDLHKRVDLAKDNKANLFVSLHIDGVSQSQEPGTTSEQTLSNGFGIYVSNKEPVYQKQSELLGSILRQELNSIYPTNPYLLKRKVGIWVLDQNVCPSVLVECGFLTDEKDRQFITQEKNQDAVARKILYAIERYAANDRHAPPVDTFPKKQTNTNASQQSAKATILASENPPLFMVDGKEVSKAEAYKLDPSSIESINILKDKTATDKYGKKGTNGAVEIKLKQKKSNADITFQQNGSTIGTGQISVDTASNSFHGTIHAVQNMSPDTVPKSEALFTKVEVEPSIDRQKWSEFLQQNLLSFVRDAASNGIDPGTYIVNVRFIVRKDGSLSDFTALNDPGHGMAKKVVEMITDSPKWKPGMQNGKPVNAYHTQPITLVIQDQ